MQMQLAIFNITTDVLVADWSSRVKSCHVRTNAHGYESCEAELYIPFLEAFLYYQQLGPLKLKVSWGSYRVWEGRLEDPTQFANTSVGLKITAFGGWVAYNDAPYTALWSETQVNDFRPILTAELAAAFPDRFTFNTTNQLFISPQKNATLGNTGTGKFGILGYQLPDSSTKFAIGVSFDYTLTTPAANWRALCQTYDANLNFIANVWVITSAAGGTLTGSINVTHADAAYITFAIGFVAADAVFAGETGTTYLKITNFRLVTSTTNRISTTLGTTFAAGTRTATPGSILKMFVGQRLFINQGVAASGESVLVTAVTATTFTAVFANAHNSADTVHAHVIYPDEIIKDCVSTLNTLNSTQVSSDIAGVQSQAIDLDQALYEDQYPSEIINQLIAKSDNQTTPRQWSALVYNDQTLIVRPRGSGLAWYADITSLDVVRTLTELYNSVYAVYSDVSNKRKLRTAVATNAPSVTQYQITRRKPINVDSTDTTQSTQIAASVLALQLDPIPRASVDLDRIFDKYGNPFPLFYIRADDTLTLRNLPPTLTAVLYDKIRTLVITRTDVDLIKGTIKLELELPMPDLNVQMAQALKKK
jgi:hypothetical protein